MTHDKLPLLTCDKELRWTLWSRRVRKPSHWRLIAHGCRIAVNDQLFHQLTASFPRNEYLPLPPGETPQMCREACHRRATP